MKKKMVEGDVARSTIYKSLSLAFSPATPEVVEFIRAGAAQKVQAALSLLPQSRLLSGLDEDITKLARVPTSVGSMESEYNRLFRHQLLCTPYETEYDPLKSLRKGQALADILGFYTAFGLKPSERLKELPDHIAVELEFMSWLTLKAAYALNRGWKNKLALTLAAEGKFLEDHLGRFIFAFCDKVERNARMAFYPALAGLLRNFIKYEIESLAVKPIRFEAVIPTGVGTGPDDSEELSCPA